MKKATITAFINDYLIDKFNVDPKDFVSKPKIFIESTLKAFEFFKLDSPPFSYDVYNIEAEALGQELVWFDHGLPEVNQSNFILKSLEDFEKLDTPKPEKTSRMPFILDVIEQCKKTNINYTLRFCAPFTLACNLRGYENLLYDIHQKPNTVHSFFTFLTDKVIGPWIEAQRKVVGENVYALGADAMCSLPLVSPKIIEEFALKYITRLQNSTGHLGTRGWRGESILKDPTKLLDLKLKANPGFLDCVDPDVNKLGTGFLGNYARIHDIPLVLGIDPLLMANGNEDDIRARVANYLQDGSEAKSIRIHLMHIPTGTPDGNIKAAIDSVHEFNNLIR